MPVERIAPEQLEAILRAQHVAHIDEDTQRILAARACGCPVDEIAEQLHLARSSVYRALERVQVAIFDPHGLEARPVGSGALVRTPLWLLRGLRRGADNQWENFSETRRVVRLAGRCPSFVAGLNRRYDMQRKLHARWFALGLMIMLAAVASIGIVPAMGATPEGHRPGEGDFQVVDLSAPSPGRFDWHQEQSLRPDNLADVTDHPRGQSEIQRAVSAFNHIAATQDPSTYRANASPPAGPSSLEETCGRFEPFELEAVEGTPATTSRETSKCSVRVQLTKGNGPASGTNLQLDGKDSCRMMFTPTSLPEGGLDVMVTSEGGCTGSHTSIAISGKAAKPNATGPAARSLSYPRHVQAKIIGNDNIHLPIFWEYQNIDWEYDYVNVYDGTFPRDKWADQYWSVSFQTGGSSWSNSPAPHYEAYNHVHFHSDGFPTSAFPNVDFWGQPTAYGYYNGDYGCSYWVMEGDGWGSYTPPGGPGLHWHAICYPW